MSTPAALSVPTNPPDGYRHSSLDDRTPVYGSLHVQTAAQAELRPWLLNPLLDTLFCCGGLVWILFLISLATNGANGPAPIVQTLAIIAIIGTHAFGEPHVAATLARVYRTAETRRQLAPWTHWAALACAVLALAGLLLPGVTPVLTKIYLLWVVQHFTAQTYGFALLYCYRAGYRLSALEKHALSLLMNLTAALAMIRQLTFYEWSANGFLAQKLPIWGPLPQSILQCCAGALAVAACAFVLLIVRRALTRGETFPLPALMTIATGVAIFTVGQKPSLLLFIYVPAFYHGSQYLILAAHYHLKRSADSRLSNLANLLSRSGGLRYYGFLFLSGMFIYVAMPRLLQEFGFSYTLAFATVFVTINIHHFLTDAAIWKLKDQKVRKVLLA